MKPPSGHAVTLGSSAPCWDVRVTTYEKWDLTQREGKLSSERYVRTCMTVVRES